MKLGFVIVYVSDVKETLQFYRDAFGLDIRMEFEDNGVVQYGEMETGGAVLGFASHEMGQMNLGGKYQKSSLAKEPFGQEVVFVADDVTEAYNTAVEAGAVSLSGPKEKPWGQVVAYVRAIEGTLIEICSPMNT